MSLVSEILRLKHIKILRVRTYFRNNFPQFDCNGQ